jgi:hypothetical protein
MKLCSDEEKNTIVKRFFLLDWQILNTLFKLSELPGYLDSLNATQLKDFIKKIYFFSLKACKDEYGDILEYKPKILMENILSFMQKLKSLSSNRYWCLVWWWLLGFPHMEQDILTYLLNLAPFPIPATLKPL